MTLLAGPAFTLSYTVTGLNVRIVDACNITTSVCCILEVHRVSSRHQIPTPVPIARPAGPAVLATLLSACFLVNSVTALSHRPRLVLLAYRSTPHPRARASLAFLLD